MTCAPSPLSRLQPPFVPSFSSVTCVFYDLSLTPLFLYIGWCAASPSRSRMHRFSVAIGQLRIKRCGAVTVPNYAEKGEHDRALFCCLSDARACLLPRTPPFYFLSPRFTFCKVGATKLDGVTRGHCDVTLKIQKAILASCPSPLCIGGACRPTAARALWLLPTALPPLPLSSNFVIQHCFAVRLTSYCEEEG